MSKPNLKALRALPADVSERIEDAVTTILEQHYLDEGLRQESFVEDLRLQAYHRRITITVELRK